MSEYIVAHWEELGAKKRKLTLMDKLRISQSISSTSTEEDCEIRDMVIRQFDEQSNVQYHKEWDQYQHILKLLDPGVSTRSQVAHLTHIAQEDPELQASTEGGQPPRA